MRRTFGYRRFEILAAAFNAVMLFLVALYILYEAYRRLQSPHEVQSWGMLAVALLGLAVNYAGMRLLSAGKETSLNVKGAYLEVWSDFLGSVGVIIGALAIQWTRWDWIDSVIAVAIALWVLPRTWTLLSQSLNILLEGVPAGWMSMRLPMPSRQLPESKASTICMSGRSQAVFPASQLMSWFDRISNARTMSFPPCATC